jgi:hypothetical protein
VSPAESFWRQDCRGPGLGHTHSSGPDCDPHAGIHAECPCRDCGVTPLVWARLVTVSEQYPGRPKQIPAPPPEESDDDIAVEYLENHEGRRSLGVWVGAWPDAYRDVLSAPGNPVWGRGRSWYGDGKLSPRDIEELTKRVALREIAIGYR